MVDTTNRVITRIDNNVMFSLMFSYLMMIIALQSALYVWISLIAVLFVLWRFLFQQKKTNLPTTAVMNTLAIGCSALIFYFSMSGGILNGMTNLLLLGSAMKLLSLNKPREVKHLCVASYFTIASAFIFKQGIGFTSFVFSIFMVNTYTLLMMHSPGLDFNKRLRYALRFFLTSIPLTLFLFALMPRLGPLWKMPTAQGSSTGLSEEISPGDFSSLAQSSELAFRVNFNGEIPQNKDLYWRTMVHENFDGKKWSVHRLRKAPQNIARVENPKQAVAAKDLLTYQVMTEATYQSWIFALDTPVGHSKRLTYHYDRTLSSKSPITQKFQYEVTSVLKHQDQRFIFNLERQINLLQPENQNKEAQQFAKDLRSQSSSDIDYINKVMSYFSDNDFVYTLEPPLLPSNPVDTFLFETRAGFCSHYASAFAVLMRAAGIPSRIVSGYQGGERANNDDYLSVYQYEAHAWNEVWIDNRGWIRMDPTSVVSPERITLGLQAAMKNDDSFLSGEMFNLIKYRQVALLNWLRNQLNNMDFYWSSWILNFDSEKQSKLFESLWGKQDSITYSIYISLIFTGFMLFIYLLSRGKLFQHKQSPIWQVHQQLTSLGRRYDFDKPISLPPITYLTQLAQHRPELAQDIEALRHCYNRCLYQDMSDEQYSETLAQAKKLIKKFKRSAPNRFRGFRLGFHR
jgi:transglutaminase-like putative cysteine protease